MLQHLPAFRLIMISIAAVSLLISSRDSTEASHDVCPSSCGDLGSVPYPFGAGQGCGAGEGFFLQNCSSRSARWTLQADGEAIFDYAVKNFSSDDGAGDQGLVTLTLDDGADDLESLLRKYNSSCEGVPADADAARLLAFYYAPSNLTRRAFVSSTDVGASLAPSPNMLYLLFDCTELSLPGPHNPPGDQRLELTSQACLKFVLSSDCSTDLVATTVDRPKLCWQYHIEREAAADDIWSAIEKYQCKSFRSFMVVDDSLSVLQGWNPNLLQLQWRNLTSASYCKICQQTKGSCGYQQSISDKDTVNFTCWCSNEYITSSPTLVCPALADHHCKGPLCNPSRKAAALFVPLSIFVATISAVAFFLVYRKWTRNHLGPKEEEVFWNSVVQRLPTRYSYQDLQSISNGFRDRLGKGGFGAVYAGVLRDGSKVAIKRLEGLRQGRKEFRAEVLILGGIHHCNLVGLIGFCAEGTHRLLVYEYMARGSLDQWLFPVTENPPLPWNYRINIARVTENPPLPWNYRINIARGAARGLAYLHGECKDTIIHLDIKPENILLDEDFVAKVSDFGLSTLMGKEETHVITTMRGTPGYLAPEWLSKGTEISTKCDVFSFGKLLMEILGGRRNFDPSMGEIDKAYFPSWLYLHMTQGQEDELRHIARVESPEEIREARLLLNTAFLCVLEDPKQRPSMDIVVRMLDGHVPELENLDLSNLFQGLHFALQLPSPNLVQNAMIEETIAPIYKVAFSRPDCTSQGAVMSSEISAR